ncbi:tetratricopeptide repeat-containing sulfotransferase family protein [Colwellia sp. 20A7]|uniref:tetratricopeptide repeat-containing sulfotransferase family protein n=1 Tax=Colwellia sp. 20A7 TaxID=2689569 RepID=UPI00135B5304|nr:tetratricopeptide repeat-containing sulfotransferase family protein [Colwellia sp. 20A7]
MKSEVTIENALRLLNANKLDEGQTVLECLLLQDPTNIQIHQLLVKIGFANKNYTLAEKHLIKLLSFKPLSEDYFNTLTELYRAQSRWQDLAALYEQKSKNKTNSSTIFFNCAYYQKLAGNFEQAIIFYNKALAIGIDKGYEVSLNVATIFSEHLSEPDKAIDILTKAIVKYPKQDSLLYNLANLYEQLGDKDKALHYFQSAYTINPTNYTALARQADICKIENEDNPLIDQLKNAFLNPDITQSDKINVGYALGKVFDDIEAYELAFHYYQQTNELDKKMLPPYDPVKFEHTIDSIIATFNKQWFTALDTKNAISTSPVFICGMFRSGSTLCEQILAAHTDISIGGEQEFFHRLMFNNYPEFPLNVVDEMQLERQKDKLLSDYLTEINRFKNSGEQLTDKRPDNFLYLGVIKLLMPNAKVIWTTRSILDNCLSIYFLRLGSSMPYATELKNIIHFYQQQERLMAHWQSLFPEDILTFNYDNLIHSPTEQTQRLLSFIGLPWEDSCLNFHQYENQVKTASVWQVRRPLYNSSSGRWNNYKKNLKTLLPLRLLHNIE